MDDGKFDIYAERKPLLEAITLYGFSTCFWVGIYIFVFFPLAINRHPNLSSSSHLIVSLVLGAVFLWFAVGLFSVFLNSISELRHAPKLVYSFSDDGITDHRADRFYAMSEIKKVRDTAKHEGKIIYLNSTRKAGYLWKSGIRSEDFKRIENYLKDVPFPDTCRQRPKHQPYPYDKPNQ